MAPHSTDPRPALIAVAGIPGTGKTTLATALGDHLKWPVISRDHIRFSTHIGLSKEESFVVFVDQLGQTLKAGRSVLAEGMPFSRKKEREILRQLATHHGADLGFIFVTCPLEVAQQRVRLEVAHLAPDRTANLVAEVYRRFEPFGAEDRVLHVDSLQTVASYFPNTLQWVQYLGRPDNTSR